ncbi:dihydroorotate dehydrogenase [Mesobacillus thioparans]|uniref:dihydroorotate dehydrogenase n=1 Tax=Mesobacillus thioparans TaxID=370439 RepID=UPI0039F0C5B3
MPDWSYHPLFKPWLSRLPGNAGREFIHRGMSAIANVPGGKSFIEFLGHMGPSGKLARNLFGLHFESPIGLSCKIDPKITGTHAFQNLGFGAIEVGPVTVSPREPAPAASLTPTEDALLLPENLQTIGLTATLDNLKKKQMRVPVLIRLEEPGTIARHFKDIGDAFVIEIDCIKSPEDLSQLKAVLNNRPILIAVRHSEVIEALPKLKAASQIADGIMVEEDSVLTSGMKALPLQQTSSLVHAITRIKTDISLPVVTSGGVAEPADALELFEAGAELVFLSGGYVASGPGLPKRIQEAMLDIREEESVNLPGWQWYWLFGLFILMGGSIVLFYSLTKVILFYDEAFMQMSRLELIAYNANLYKFMSHDRMTLAGTMISGGFIYMQLARHGIRHGIHWTRRAFNIGAITGFLGILLFLGFGYFDWLHGLFWLILLPVYLIGFRKTRGANEPPASKNRTNHRAWKKAVYGQLLFVVLGFSFVMGGIMISLIGATSVFVDTDVQYICMTPDQLNALNEKLIPVIAHDRAGFGSALFSVGLLVLTLALWGFHEGSAWVWRTFLIGGIPAFAAGILTHFYIGYIDFIHLLPAYFALTLYIGGLLLTRDYFNNR